MDTSRRLPTTHRFLTLVVLLATACSGVEDQIADLRGRADEATDQVQFCLAVTRALTAVDGGSSLAEAQAAAEEVLTHVPDELRTDAELVAQRLREAAEARDRSPLDDEFRAAAERLRDDTQDMCTP